MNSRNLNLGKDNNMKTPKIIYVEVYDDGKLSSINSDDLRMFQEGENVAIYELKEIKKFKATLE